MKRQWLEHLPRDFDYNIYVNHPQNRDLARFDVAAAQQHYEIHGAVEGRVCSRVTGRQTFVDLIPLDVPILEIGPFFTPTFKRPGADVYYLDVLSCEALKNRAASIAGARVEAIPEIDYIWEGQPYADFVNRKFPIVYSSHNIEHQPCLVTHLLNLESIMVDNGAIFLVVPDKRYCFDHFLCETQLSEVVDALINKRDKPLPKDIFDHRFFTTHNDPVRHWRGDHGDNPCTLPFSGERSKLFLAELRRLSQADSYSDVHVWKFTPQVFRLLIDNLCSLGMIGLRIERIYQTVNNSNEFYAVLVKK